MYDKILQYNQFSAAAYAVDCETKEFFGVVRGEGICRGDVDEVVYSFNGAFERTALRWIRSVDYATAVLLS